MIKAVGMALIIFASCMLGNNFAMRLERRVKILEQMRQFCFDAGEQIRIYGLPPKKIVCNGVKKFNRLSFLEKYPQYAFCNELKKDELNVINSFLDGLGKSDTEGQIKHCNEYILQLDMLSKTAAEECFGKNRLYRILGVFCGVCIAVIII